MVQLNDSEPKVSPSLLEAFWSLAEYDVERRKMAIGRLLEETKTNDDCRYTLGRLIRGLASGRAAARVGYAAALVSCLESPRTPFNAMSLADVTAIANQQLTAADLGKGSEVAKLLFCEAVIRANTTLDKASAKEFVEETMRAAKSQNLTTLSCRVLIDLAIKVGKKRFKHTLLPFVEPMLSVGVKSWTPDTLWISIELCNAYHKILNPLNLPVNGNNLCSKDTVETVKKILQPTWTKATLHPVVNSLLSAAARISADTLTTIWTEIIIDGISAGVPGERALAYISRLTVTALSISSKPTSILSDALLRLLVTQLTTNTISKGAGRAELNRLVSSVMSAVGNDEKTAMTILQRCYAVSPSFDDIIGIPLTRQLLEGLPEQRRLSFVDQVATGDTSTNVSSMKRRCSELMKLFVLSKDITVKASSIEKLQRELLRSEDEECRRVALSFLYDCLCRLLVLSGGGSGGKFKADVSDVNLKLIRDSINKLIAGDNIDQDRRTLLLRVGSCLLNLDSTNSPSKGFSVLLAFVVLESHTAATESWEEWAERIEEILHCHERFATPEQFATSKREPSWLDVVVDLMLQLLSVSSKRLRPAIQVSFRHFCHLLSIENLKAILTAINPVETDVFANAFAEEEDDDVEMGSNDESSGEEETPVNGQNDDDSDDSSNVGSGSDSPIDPKLIESVRSALGTAAAVSDGEEEEDDSFSDDTMLKLDETLSAAFRSHLQSRRRSSITETNRQQRQEAVQFRMRAFDLLLIFVNSAQHTSTLIKLMPRLAQIAVDSLKMKGQEIVLTKARNLLEILRTKRIDWKLLETNAENTLTGVFDELVAIASATANPLLQMTLGDSIAHLMKVSRQNAVEPVLIDKLSSCVSEFAGDSGENGRHVPASALSPSFSKHPNLLLPLLPTLMNLAFDENIRVYQRTEICRWCSSFVRKDLIAAEEKSSIKVWKKFTKAVERGMDDVLSTLLDGPSENVKPRYVAEALNLFQLVSTHAASLPLKTVVSANWLKERIEPLTKEKAWSSETMTKVALATRRVNGKRPYKLLSVATKLLRGADVLEETTIEKSAIKKARLQD